MSWQWQSTLYIAGKSDLHITDKPNNFRSNSVFSDRYLKCHAKNQRAKIGAAYAEYEMLPSCERNLNQTNSNWPWKNYEGDFFHNSSSKNSLYKKAASAFSLKEYENETDSYNDEPLVNTFSGGIVYDTDCKYHYDRIIVVPGNDKWRNSSNYSKSNCSTNSSDTSYSVPKPLPRRDSLRARTKSVFQSRSEHLPDPKNVNNIVGVNQLKNSSAVVSKMGSCSIFNSRANSAPPAPPPQRCNPNRFTWWFDNSAASNQIQNAAPPSKSSRYVMRMEYFLIYIHQCYSFSSWYDFIIVLFCQSYGFSHTFFLSTSNLQ